MTSTSTPLPQVRLGGNGPVVGVQGLGCMGMSEFYGATDETEARATLERALELGVGLFDTADMYGMGDNERFLSPFVRANRDRVIIASKFGYARTPETPDDWSLDNRPEFIRAAVDRSLQRLGLDRIDLYYMHRRDPAVPLAESVGAMAELVAAGKVRQLGLCSVGARELREAHAIHPIAALQSEWSLFTRQIEASVIPTAAELGITVVPYSPLGRGLLTGAAFADELDASDSRRTFPRFAAENRDANMRLVGTIEALAAERGVMPAQVALAWVHEQGRRLGVSTIPIPGTRKRSRLEANVAAASLRLNNVDMAALEPLADAVRGIAV